MVTYNYYGYMPSRFHTQCEDVIRVQKLIFDFKSGVKDAVYYTSHIVVNSMLNTYSIDANKFVIVCAPTSTQAKYDRRYKLFNELVSSKLDMLNAFSHVHILGSRKSLHKCASHTADESNYRISIDADFFAGKKVIIFDDLITTGRTAQRFADILTDAGAEVVGGIFIALTYKKGIGNEAAFFASDYKCHYCSDRVDTYIYKTLNA